MPHGIQHCLQVTS